MASIYNQTWRIAGEERRTKKAADESVCVWPKRASSCDRCQRHWTHRSRRRLHPIAFLSSPSPSQHPLSSSFERMPEGRSGRRANAEQHKKNFWPSTLAASAVISLPSLSLCLTPCLALCLCVRECDPLLPLLKLILATASFLCITSLSPCPHYHGRKRERRHDSRVKGAVLHLSHTHTHTSTSTLISYCEWKERNGGAKKARLNFA